jgi:hypothetical protein
MEPKDFADATIKTLGAWKAIALLLTDLRRLVEQGKQVIISRIREATRKTLPSPRALKAALLRGDVTVGDVVRLRGYISRYCQIILPVSYLNSRIDMRETKRVLERAELRSPGAKAVGTSWAASQLPVTAFPRLKVGNDEVCCLFLYASGFQGFLYSTALDSGDRLNSLRLPGISQPRVRIPEHAWPVPVLMAPPMAQLCAEKKVELQAVLQELPSELLEHFRVVYNTHYQRQYLSQFVMLQTSVPRIVCLTAFDDDAIRDISDEDYTKVMAIYAEGHVEGTEVTEKLMDDLIGVLPRAEFDMGPWTFTNGSNWGWRMAATSDDINVFVKPPGVVGFYAQTSRAQPIESVHAALSRTYRQFDEAVQQRMRVGSGGSAPSLHLDYLYDYERQWDFDPQGMWQSQHAYELLRAQPDLDATKRWLRGES